MHLTAVLLKVHYSYRATHKYSFSSPHTLDALTPFHEGSFLQQALSKIRIYLPQNIIISSSFYSDLVSSDLMSTSKSKTLIVNRLVLLLILIIIVPVFASRWFRSNSISSYQSAVLFCGCHFLWSKLSKQRKLSDERNSTYCNSLTSCVSYFPYTLTLILHLQSIRSRVLVMSYCNKCQI